MAVGVLPACCRVISIEAVSVTPFLVTLHVKVTVVAVAGKLFTVMAPVEAFTVA